MAVRRGFAIVVAFSAMVVCVALAGVVVLYLVLSRGPAVASGTTLVLRPGGEVQEAPPGDVVGALVGGTSLTVQGFVETLQKAARDTRVTGLLLQPDALELPYWGRLQELRDAVLAFRMSGKPVVAFLEYGGEREYYLASAADKVLLLPASPLDLTGVASYEVFLRGFFDRVGVTPDFLQIAEYKTAPNQLTERGFTPAHREMAESLNRDLYDQLVRGIAASRGMTEAEVRALIDDGPLLPEEALRAGLVDGLAYEDQLDELAAELRGDDATISRMEAPDYARTRSGAAGRRGGPRVALLYATGVIASGRSGYDPVNGPVAGSQSLVEQIRRIRDDESIRAVILRIDSPGGSSVASDVVWRELQVLRERWPDRPIIASMSDLAASGGYYIALPAHAIVAQPGTLTGSIGIYAGKFTVGGALEKLGIGTGTLTAGANADIYSPFTPFTPDQRARLDASLQAFYDGFVQRVANSRGTTVERIRDLARGRVWTGAQARANGLVDELGGMDVAVRLAKARAGIGADEDVELVVFAPRRTFYEALLERIGGTAGEGALLRALGGDVAAGVRAVSAAARFRRGEPLALMPFAFFH